jgi:hypothetical protein
VRRFAFCVTVAGLVLAACGNGDTAKLPEAHVSPIARDDRYRLIDAAATTFAPLANDSNPQGGVLSLTVIEGPLLGTASVNADQTITLAGMPTGFRGVNRLKYRVTDSQGAVSDAYVLFFVAIDPFRAVLPLGPDGDLKIAISDLASGMQFVNTGSTAKVSSFIPSRDGEVIVFTHGSGGLLEREICATHPVRVEQPRCYEFPDNLGIAGYSLSPDGRWIVVYTMWNGIPEGSLQPPSLWLFDAENPNSPLGIQVRDLPQSEGPIFSADSQHLHFLAAPRFGLSGVALYRLAKPWLLSPDRLTAPGAAGSIDSYVVSDDETRIVLVRTDGLWRLNPQLSGIETRVSREVSSTESLSVGAGFTPDIAATTYLVAGTSVSTVETAQLMGNPNSHVVRVFASDRRVAGPPMMRSDGQAVLVYHGLNTPNTELFTWSTYEVPDDGIYSESFIGSGSAAYDVTGNTLIGLTQQREFLQIMRRLYVVYRTPAGFTSQFPGGTPGMYVHKTSAFANSGRGAMLLQEAVDPYLPGAAPSSGGNIGIVNFAAPQAILTVTPVTELNSATMYLVDAQL